VFLRALGLAFVFACSPVGLWAQTHDTDALTLRQAIATALAQSPRLRQSDDARQMSEIRAEQADSRFALKANPSLTSGTDAVGNPQRTFGLGVSKLLPTGADLVWNATSFRYGQFGEVRDTGYTLSVSQPLFRGFGASTAAERALTKRSIVTATRSASDARRQLIVNTAESYFAVLRQRRQLENANRVLDRARHLHVASDARARVGMATELDVLRADLLTARAESSAAMAQEQLESAGDALNVLLGRRLDEPLSIEETELSDEALDALELGPGSAVSGSDGADVAARLAQSAMSSRLDVIEAWDRVQDARKSESIARWNLLPATAFTMTYTQRGLGTPPSEDLFGPFLNGWRFGVTSSYSVDRSTERVAMATTNLAVRAAEQDARELEDRVRSEVRQALRAWQRGKATVDIQSKAVALAERQLRLSQLRYDRGVAGNFDVVDAENLLFQAETDLDAARVERALAGINLRKVAGLLDPSKFLP